MDFPMNSMVIFHSICKRLPEGNDGFVWFIYMGRIEWDTFFRNHGDTFLEYELIGGLEHDFDFSILLGMS